MNIFNPSRAAQTDVTDMTTHIISLDFTETPQMPVKVIYVDNIEC